MKHLRHLFTALSLLCATIATAYDFKVGGIYYNITNSTDKTVEVTEGSSYYTGSVVIPESVEYDGITYNVTCIGSRAFMASTGLTSITIPNSVTNIGVSAFSACSNLSTITIPSSVASIGGSAFFGTAWYNNQPDGVVYAGKVLYKYKGEMPTSTSITIEEGTLGITESAFQDCVGLTSVTIPNSVTSIGSSAFQGCTSLISMTIPNSVTSIGNYTFYNCASLTSMTIPNNVTSIGNYAFNGCTSLKDLHIENGTSKLYLGVNYSVSTGYEGKGLFYDCPLETLYLGRDLSYTKSANYGYSPFAYVRTLKSAIIGNSVTSISDGSFNGCFSLKDLHIEDGTSTLSLGINNKDFGRIHTALFVDCPLETLYIGRNLSYFSSDYYGYSPFAYIKTLKSVNFGKACTSIPANMFYDCGTIVSLTISSSVLNINSTAFSSTTPKKTFFLGNTPPEGYSYAKGTMNYVSSATNYGFGTEYTNLSSMFEVGGVKYVLVSAKDRCCDVVDCNYNYSSGDILIDSLVTYRNVKLKVRNVNGYALYDNDKMQNATVKNNGTIGQYAFYGCGGMQNATLGNSVEAIGSYAFAGCASLEEIVIPDNVPSVGSYCFNNCTSLERAIVGSGVKILNPYTFSGCSALSEVQVGENVATIDTYVFENCSSLPQINIPQATTKINNDVFNGCTNLKIVIIEDKAGSLTLGYKKGSRPYQLFADCKLDSVYIGCKLEYYKTNSYGYSPFYANKYLRSVTYNDAEVAIYGEEFKGCSNLQNVVFGKGITTIGNNAFENCTSLASITIPDWVTAMGSSCFAGCTAMESAKVGTGVQILNTKTFSGCSALNEVEVGKNVATIDTYVFENCVSLPQINIPQATNVINDYVFYNCKSLADVIIEDRTAVLTLGSNGSSSSSSATSSTNPLFYSCPLDSVYIGGKISYKTDRIYGFSPFFRNTSLRTVVVADNETLVYDNEFYGCSGLTDVVIGDGVTSIGNWAFSGCVSLLNFSFGSKVETIGEEAFSDCTSMVKLVSSCNVPPVCGNQALADINVWDCTLYVPNDYIDDYYFAEQWWDFFFIDGAEYNITFMIGNEKYSEATIKYGAEITLPVPTKEGYTFQGWVDVPTTMPADNIVVYGSFKANDYTITYIVDGEVYETVTVACDAVITPIEAPELDGYTFNHWEVLPQIMPANDIEVIAVYDEIPTEVTITVGEYGSTVYCSKYALDFSNVSGLKAYAATGYNTNSGVVTMTTVVTTIEGMGLYLMAAPGEYKVPIIDYSDDNSLNMLVGNLEKSIVNAVSDDGIYANYKYTIKSGDATPKFYQYSDGSSISAGKAYLQIPLDWIGANVSKAIGLRFEDGKTTDIDATEGVDDEIKTIYDLQGRSTKETSNGIYIIDGKKVYIK